MPFRNTPLLYGSVTKFFHWLIATLVIFMLIYGFFLDDFPKSIQPVTYNIHKLIGLTVLSLMVLRGLWALVNVKPLLLEAPAWQRALERLVHFMLYFFVILMPLSGWIGSVAGGHPPYLGNFEFTLPINKSEAVDSFAFEIHKVVAIVLIVLITLHVLAAFYHHFIKKDNVLIRMLPDRWHR